MTELTLEQKQALAKARARMRAGKRGTLENPASMQALPDDFQMPEMPEPEPRAPYQMPYPQPSVSRETAKKYLPFAGGALGATIAGPGLLAAGIGAAIGGAGGETARQGIEGQDLDLWDITKEGAISGGGTLVGGLMFNSLAKAAKAIFSPKPLPPGAKEAAEFAARENLPLPIKGADPTSRAAMAQSVAEMGLPGRIKSISDARQINTYINQSIGQMTTRAKAIDEVAVKGQQFFKDIYDTAKGAGEAGFQKFTSQVGDETVIPMRNFLEATGEAIEKMKGAGISGALMTKLRTIQKAETTELPLNIMDGIRKDIGKIARKNNNVKTISDDLKEAILKDYDEVGAQLGISAREMAEEAIQKYALFAKLTKEFPQLERFGKQFGERGGTMGSKQWFGELFTEGNAKALNEIRKQSPKLYQELSDTWLAQLLERHTTATTGMFGKVLDGEKFRAYFEANKTAIKKILGTERTEVLNNFTNYTKHVGDALKTQPIGGQEATMRLGEVAGGMAFPHIFIPNEAASYLLAKGLSNPNSVPYKLFTTGPSLSFKKASKLSLESMGQAGAREKYGSD